MEMNCPKCLSPFKNIPDRWEGVKIKCAKCGHSFVASVDEKIRNDSLKDLSKSQVSQETIIKHSFVSNLILMFIFLCGGGFLFIYYMAGHKLVTEMLTSPFYYILVIIIGSFIVSKITKNCEIKFTKDRIETINNFNYSLVEVKWDEIQYYKIYNFIFVQIVVLILNESSIKPWFNHFSFSSKQIIEAIYKICPQLKRK